MTRREALRLGLAGLACAACGGAFRFGETVAAAADGGSLATAAGWEAWRRRGWAREARHARREGDTWFCELCPNACVLEPGDRGRCRTRLNRDGALYTLAYANPCSFHADPVEKKPLFHFLPGSRSFSLATAGCVFRCLNCQNWEISQKRPEETKSAAGPELRLRPPLPAALSLAEMERLSLFPEDLPAVAAAMDCASVAYTYSEPVAFYEYVFDCCRAVREQKRKNIMVTCGSIREAPLRELAPHLDAAHVDLKGFDEEVYRRLNSGALQPVLGSLKLLRENGVWVEIVNLIVPSWTDKPEAIRRMCGWIAANLGPDVPVHFSRFFPAYRLTQLSPTPVEILLQAREIAKAAGLRYIYLGNIRGIPDAETTFCPNCRKPVVGRDVFAVTHLEIVDGKCRFCRHPVPGVWS